MVKFVNKTKKYHAHDEKNECGIGDTVKIDGNSSFEQNKKMEISSNNRKGLSNHDTTRIKT